MFDYHWIENVNTVVKNKGYYTLTFNKWAGLLYVDNSNAYTHRFFRPDKGCRRITEEEADAFIEANMKKKT